jgi:hypothetical protein
MACSSEVVDVGAGTHSALDCLYERAAFFERHPASSDCTSFIERMMHPSSPAFFELAAVWAQNRPQHNS